MINRNQTRDDTKVNVKIMLSGLWASMVFVFAYVDIFGFWRSDILNGALAGTVPGAGFEINQSFLTLTTLYILIPSMMISFSLIAPTRFNRPVNIVVSTLYAASVVASAVGETWAYYILGSVVETVLLLTVAGIAWFWPTTTHQVAKTVPGKQPGSIPTTLPRSN
ncbi:MAG TPA: DUF6326 family protein [Microlunatus sp.]|nr:DUF6326 family protein [Microlunatus sp.]